MTRCFVKILRKNFPVYSFECINILSKYTRYKSRIRDSVVIYDGNIGSIAREKDQVKEVKQGLECGITIENFNDIKENDIIEAYEIVEKER